MTSFERMLATILHAMVALPGRFETLKKLGLKLSYWPQGRRSELARMYESFRDQGLSHRLSAASLSDSWEEIRFDEFQEPDSWPTFFEAYREALKAYWVPIIARRMAEDPARAGMHVAFLTELEDQHPEPAEALNLCEAMDGIVETMLKRAETGEAVRVISGWPLLSEAIGGWNESRVSMIQAATGFGKSNLAMNLALKASKNMGVLFINQEMSLQDLGERMVMAETGTPFHVLKRNPASVKEKLGEMFSRFLDRRMFFTDGKTKSVEQIRGLVRRLKNSHGLDLVIVDYDQKLDLKITRETPEWKALQIAIEELEALAKDLHVHVMVLCQEGQAGEISGSRRSKFPASTVLRFYREGTGPFVIEAVKNRFGKYGVKIEVEYEPEKSLVREVGFFESEGRELAPYSGSLLRTGGTGGAGSVYPHANTSSHRGLAHERGGVA